MATPGSSLVQKALHQQTKEGLCITSAGSLLREHHLTVNALPGEKPVQIIRRLAMALNELNATIVRHEIFCPLARREDVFQAMQSELGCMEWPIMWIAGTSAAQPDVLGMHVFALTGAEVETVSLNGRTIGRVFTNGTIRHCLLGDIRPSNPSTSRPVQYREVFENIERALREAGMGMTDVARAWFFLDGILAGYGSFNEIRNKFYRQKGILEGLVPASTGVGSRNPAQAALTAAVWAVSDSEGPLKARDVLSPLQGASLEYGSAFSRAVIIPEPNCRRLFVSGTASIGLDGQSLHQGEVKEQISLTMKVVRTLLKDNGLDFGDVTRATAYLKDNADISVFEAWRAKHDLQSMPVVAVQADICRDELLFEIELDAISFEAGKQECTQFTTGSSGR